MLTPRMKATLDFITGYLDNHGYSPTFAEIMEATGVTSKAGIFRLLQGLEERGHIRRLPYRKRAIEVIETPSLATNLTTVPLGLLAQEVERRGYLVGEARRKRDGTRYFKQLFVGAKL